MARFEHGRGHLRLSPGSVGLLHQPESHGGSRSCAGGACRAVLDCARYPDPACRGPRRATARRDGVEEDQILCGNGASGSDLPHGPGL